MRRAGVKDFLVAGLVLLVSRLPKPAPRPPEKRIVPEGEPIAARRAARVALLLLAAACGAAFIFAYASTGCRPDPAHGPGARARSGRVRRGTDRGRQAARGHRGAPGGLPAGGAPRRAAGDRRDRGRERRPPHAQAPLQAGRSLRPEVRSALALLVPLASLGPVLDLDRLADTLAARAPAGRRGGPAVPAAEIEQDSFYTAFPEGAEPRAARRAARRRPPAAGRPAPAAAARGYDANGIVAYSKICTHAGCAISLYRTPLFDPAEPAPALVCPCHYSTFDPAAGGKVTFGPAGRKLPMLPLYVDRARPPACRRQLRRRRRALVVGRPQRGAAVIRRLVRVVDQRTGTAPFLRKSLRYLFPDHWSFLLGEVALYAFVVLVATGTYLALFYEAAPPRVVYHGPYEPLQGREMSQAYRSVLDLSLSVKPGLLIRQTHHWAANVFIAAIVLHLLRVFFTGAYRKPRELTYWIGVTMLMLALLEGYLGYSLVDDLLSGMGLAIGYSVALSIPFVGANIASAVWDGPFPGGRAFFPRMYIAHVFLFPMLIALLLGAPPRARGAAAPHAVPAAPRQTERKIVGVPAYPGQAPRSIGL